MSAARPALFPEPDPDIPELSAALAGSASRLRLGEAAKWTRLSVTTVDCMECAVLQHERRGAYGPRRQARWRRKGPQGTRLDLCRAHAEGWKKRDAADSGEGD